MEKEIFYKTQDSPLFEVNGWKVACNSEQEVVDLAKKRGTTIKIDDVKFIGNVTTICGYADNYDDVINWKEKDGNLLKLCKFINDNWYKISHKKSHQILSYYKGNVCDETCNNFGYQCNINELYKDCKKDKI